MAKTSGLLSSPQASQVLIEIMKGNDYANAISKELKITHGGAIQHLQELESAQLIFSKKNGTKRTYVINWSKLLVDWRMGEALLCITRTQRATRKKYEHALHEDSIFLKKSERSFKSSNALLAKLSETPLWQEFMKNYFVTEFYMSLDKPTSILLLSYKFNLYFDNEILKKVKKEIPGYKSIIDELMRIRGRGWVSSKEEHLAGLLLYLKDRTTFLSLYSETRSSTS